MTTRIPLWPTLLGLAALSAACQGPPPPVAGPMPPAPGPAAIAVPAAPRPFQGAGAPGEAAPAPAAPATSSPRPNGLDAPAPTSIGPVATMIPFNVLRENGATVPQIPQLDPFSGQGPAVNLDVILLDLKARTVLDLPGINRPGLQGRPFLTADGRTITYLTNLPGHLDIWRYDLTTRLNNTLSFLNTDEREFGHVISLDGNHLVYLQGPVLGERRMFRRSLKSGERYAYGGYAHLSGLAGVSDLSCNLDASLVAFSAHNGHDSDIFMMDFTDGLEGTPPYVNTIHNERFPWLSPDGQLLLFVSDRAGSPDIYLLDRRTGRLDNLPFANSTAIDTYPFFIGGTQIMFLSNRGGRFRLYRYDWHTQVLDTLAWIDPNGR